MEIRKQIENNIKKQVDYFWKWALKLNSKEQILNGEIDSPSFPDWQKTEAILQEAFQKIDFTKLENETLDNIIFIIAQQWDIGRILNWFNKGGEEIGHIGMTKEQLQILCKRGLKSNLVDAKSQFAASLFKIKDEQIAVEMLLVYYKDENEYVRRCSLLSLNKLKYKEITPLLLKTWDENDEYGRMTCLQIWSETNDDYFKKYSEIAKNDKRKNLRNFAQRLIKEKNML